MFMSTLNRATGSAGRHLALLSNAHAFHTTGAARDMSGTPPTRVVNPLEQVKRVKQLQTQVASVNSKTGKESIIGQYPDLRDLLEHVYDPNHRTHLSSASLQKYAADHPRTSSEPYDGPSSMTALFDVLSSRKVTGNAAKALVLAFLTHHGIKEEAELEVFCRLLDRNLVAGFGARTLMQVQWQTSPVSSPSNASTPIIASTSAGKKPEAASPRNTAEKADPAASQQSVAPTTRSLKAFSCALGKTVLPPFSTLFKGGVTWYASRKLDGVRCITFIDFDVSDVQAPAFVQVQHLSRTGKPFFTLGNLEPQLRLIEGYPGLREMLEKDIELVEDLEQKGRTIKRLVLDGEVCVMVPSPTAPAHAPQSSGTDSDDEHDSFTQLWSDTGLVEDFPATVSEIRRQHHTIARPAYYLFDLLSYAEFAANTSLPRIPGLGKTFSVRMTDLQNLCAWLSNEGQGDASIIKALKQQVVTKEEDVEGMVETAARSGWEGLVLRADKGYVGKRSNDVRKFKQWQDAEYTVTNVDVSRQRLAIGGVFDEYDAVAAVNIRHKGHLVAVGSGLAAEQRIRWAKDPSQIIGKQITVEYFSESEAQGRQGQTSLRFPRIKTVWDGKRDI